MTKRGFTLIELLITIAIMSLAMVALLRNFSNSRIDLYQVASKVVGDVRLAQNYSLTSWKFQNTHHCGFGISQRDGNSYYLYSGPNANDCSGTKNFQDNTGTPIVKTVVLDSRVALKNSPEFDDIFFVPPDPKVFINDQIMASPELIGIGKIEDNCSSSPNPCIYVCVFTSGKVEIFKNPSSCI